MGRFSWIQAITSTNNIQYTFPPVFQDHIYPSIITFIDKTSLYSGSDGTQLEVSCAENEQHIAAYIRPVPIPYVVDPRMISLGGLKDQNPSNLLCRFTSYVSDLIYFIAETSDDACDLIITWAQSRNKNQKHKPAAWVSIRRKKPNCKLNIKCKLQQRLGVEMSSIFCAFFTEYSLAGVSSRGLKTASIARQRRQHLGLQWNCCMLNVISKGLIRTFDTPLTQYSYIIALDSARLPQPLHQLESWLAKHWGEWLQQASSIQELSHVYIPVLMSSLALQCQNTMQSRSMTFHVQRCAAIGRIANNSHNVKYLG